ncbi:esterase [Paenibacillus sp. ACRRX]|uniref:alpha/beta hydrolase n=1 Tax=Paenibacillus sp. ACRRX TaxID=2918206 RepID=UPI001EF49A18|nr:alpha/beta hydrolase-fold protein [Paenibacillus sp. ACRRX]MCG7410456.1 esterase [Paenibacillus sp. ACRRX]
MKHSSSILRNEGFYSDVLDNMRDLVVYLPPSYQIDLNRRYPVLYVHDGQNIFHPAFNGYSWNIHTTADQLIKERIIEDIIVVGVPNMGMERADEFTHDLEGVCYQDDKVPIQPRGELYERFIIEEVMPFMDAVFRTKTGPEHTALMGSSRGGQVTYHIGMRRPDVFGMLGIVSPYFYCVDPQTQNEVPMYHTFTAKQPVSKIWIDLGSREGLLVREKHVREVTEKLLQLGYSPDDELVYLYEPGAAHVERDWAARVSAPLIHFFGDRGEACALKLNSGEEMEEVGLIGPSCRLNPIVEYDSGFRMTVLRAFYRIEDERIAQVREDGTVIPLQLGETKVTVQYGDLEAAVTLRVVAEIPSNVQLELIVHAPLNTPDGVKLYAWFPLVQHPETDTYTNQLQIPMYSEWVFQVSREDGKVEVDAAGNKVERHYKALADAKLHIHVEQWSS